MLRLPDQATFEKLQADIKARSRIVRFDEDETKRGPKPQVAVPFVPKPYTNEERLAEEMSAAGLVFERQFKWLPKRRYRADFAFPAANVIVELDGSVHRIRSRFDGDIKKSQEAILAGWTLLRVSSGQVRRGEAVPIILRVLKVPR